MAAVHHAASRGHTRIVELFPPLPRRGAGRRLGGDRRSACGWGIGHTAEIVPGKRKASPATGRFVLT